MDAIMDTTTLEINDVQVIIRGLYAVAKSDGIHDSELVMMREFYDTCRADVGGLAEFDDIISQPFDAAEAKEILGTDELKNIFLTSCWFLAFADGQVTDLEKSTIAEFGRALEMSDEQLTTIHEQVKDFLLAHISNIHNIDALKEVMSEMD